MLSPRLHTALFYAAFYGAIGAYGPFWPVWLQDWGLSAGEVGLFTMIGMAMRVVTGLAFPALADRLGMRRRMTFLLGLAGAALFLAHLMIGQTVVLMAATVLTAAVLAGLAPLGEALGVGAAQRYRFGYALPRSVGSLAFLVANLVCGAMVARYGANAALFWIVVFLAGAGLLGRDHPGGGTDAGGPPPSLAEIGRLVGNPVFLVFALAMAAYMASGGVYLAYASIHWRALGLDEGTIGALWALGVLAEIVMMATIGARLVERLGAIGAVVLATAVSVLRWAAMMTDPLGPALWLLQATHAVTFTIGHLGMMAFIAAAVPDRYGGTAQGAVAGLFAGGLMALTIGLSALTYPHWGGLTYGIGAGMALVALALLALLARIWHGARLAV